MKLIGYGIIGGGEADRYLNLMLDSMKRVVDDAIFCLNNATDAERELIKSFGLSASRASQLRYLDKIEDIEENKQSRAQLKVKIDALQQECESLRDFLEFTKQTK